MGRQSARVGASLLRGLGLDGLLVARSLADYADIAARAAGPGRRGASPWGRPWLRAARRRLAAARREAPLFDPARWVRAMEAAVRAAWEVDAAAAAARGRRAQRAAAGADWGPAAMHVAVSAAAAAAASAAVDGQPG